MNNNIGNSMTYNATILNDIINFPIAQVMF